MASRLWRHGIVGLLQRWLPLTGRMHNATLPGIISKLSTPPQHRKF